MTAEEVIGRLLQTSAGVVIVALFFSWVVAWILFPVVVWMKLNEVVRVLKNIETQAERSANNTSPSGQKTTTSVRYIAGING